MLAAKLHKKLPIQALFGEDDLLQEGTFGLASAIDSFDPDRGVKFGTFAARRIRGRMLDALRLADWVPRLERQRGVEAPVIQSLHATAAATEVRNVEFAEIVEDKAAQLPYARLSGSETWQALIRILPTEFRLMMTMRYVDDLTMKEIGQAIGMSESRISQIHAEALRIMKAAMTDPVHPWGSAVSVAQSFA
jgi:RNA polymerase sigma factor for flagellar operon FliA